MSTDPLGASRRGLAYRVEPGEPEPPSFATATVEAMRPFFDEVCFVAGPPGEALLQAQQELPESSSICMVDQTLTPPADTVADALVRLGKLPTPVRLLVPRDTATGPLAARGGLVEIDRWILEGRDADVALSSPKAQSWPGFLDVLEDLAEDEACAVYDRELAAEHSLWLRDGLPLAAEQGVPMYPWELFSGDPLQLQRWGISGQSTYQWLVEHGVDQGAFWSHLLASCPPQTWYTNLALLNVFDPERPLTGRSPTEGRGRPPEVADTPGADAAAAKLTTAVICHVFYPDMLAEILEFAANVPKPRQLVVTTDTEEKAQTIRADVLTDGRFQDYRVRVVATNRGRDISAFLLDCHDVLLDPTVDLVVKLHSKKSVQDPASVSEFFRRHLFENLVGTPFQAEQIRGLFTSEPLLGMVFPPVIHMGLPTMGNGWTLNRVPAQGLAPRLGFRDETDRSHDESGLKALPFDQSTPLSPYGSMFWARREALLPLVEAEFEAEEFPDHTEYRDGSLAHVLERLVSYTVFSQGYYARCVQTEQLAALTGLTLDSKVDALSAHLPPFPEQQVAFLERARGLAPRQLALRAYQQLQHKAPGVAGAVLTVRRELRGG